MQPPPVIRCAKCGSDQITANKKGFSGKKAVGGAILTGGIGLLAGTIGSNNVKITCLQCGHIFKPGEGLKENQLPMNQIPPAPPAKWTTGGVIVMLVFLVIIVLLVNFMC